MPDRDHLDSDELPDAGLFWRWAAQSTRPIAGWVLIAIGAIAILVGYLGVSRESLVAKQIPYLLSGGITGMVLVAVGAFFLGTEDVRRQLARLKRVEEKVDELHRVLLVPAEGEPAETPTPNGRRDDAPDGPAELIALPEGTTYHRARCRMVVGKLEVAALTPSAVAGRGLTPCPICEPEPVTV